MPVTEIERRELVNRLVATIGEESTETLMQCLLPEGRDQLATKDDLKEALKDYATKDDLKEALKVLETTLRTEFRGEFAMLRGHIDLTLGKQLRIHVAMLMGVLLTLWGTLIVVAVG